MAHLAEIGVDQVAREARLAGRRVVCSGGSSGRSRVAGYRACRTVLPGLRPSDRIRLLVLAVEVVGLRLVVRGNSADLHAKQVNQGVLRTRWWNARAPPERAHQSRAPSNHNSSQYVPNRPPIEREAIPKPVAPKRQLALLLAEPAIVGAGRQIGENSASAFTANDLDATPAKLGAPALASGPANGARALENQAFYAGKTRRLN